MDTTKNCRLQSWTSYKSADCRWISITILCVSFTNSATGGRLEQVQLCNRLIDQSADDITGLKCAKEYLILKYKTISRILDRTFTFRTIKHDMTWRSIMKSSNIYGCWRLIRYTLFCIICFVLSKVSKQMQQICNSIEFNKSQVCVNLYW